MKKDELNKERRKQKRLDQLGNNHSVCVICGEDDWRCLELHHIAGQAYDDALVIVCRNCHRKLSDDQKDHPPQIGKPVTTTESIGRFLLGLANLFTLLVEKLTKFGHYLIEKARAEAKGAQS